MIKNGEDKYYIFAISNKYSRLFGKITPCFEFINKEIMNKLDKILAVVIVTKNPLIAYSGNTLDPILIEERIFREEKLNTNIMNIPNDTKHYSIDNYDQQPNQYNHPINNNSTYSENDQFSQGTYLF